MVCLCAKFLKQNQDVSHLPESCSEWAILSIFSESIFVLHTCYSGLVFPCLLTLNSSLLRFPLPPMFLWFTLYLTSRIICTYSRKFFLTESRAAPLFLVPCLASTFHPGGNHSSAPLRGFWALASISSRIQSTITYTPTPTQLCGSGCYLGSAPCFLIHRWGLSLSSHRLVIRRIHETGGG